ncbi:MAG: thiamine phosphate synthase [Candidatus Eremiobacteraeota bacterium]|nr:thiamine phosphate synthase [Candidatus Eremiobacteraeota bacterium]MBC5803143.1 thiamine phosphate synthase [Candidatus Eremiobacteraeota bacterium]MBC5820769.1 thiamine phosphate synthase [Candidatus Eremiobacteraeota bacterium]
MAEATLHGIYGIIDADAVSEPLPFAGALMRGGIRVLQYRAKAGVDAAVLEALCRCAHAGGARLIVNDDFQAALQADGWHAGQEDLAEHDVVRLRRVLGERLLGISCGTAAEARDAEAAGADYVGVGPFAATASKADAGRPLGSAGLRTVVAATSLPVVAVGGIGPANVAAVAASGAAMAAVISALATAADPASAARDLVRRWAAAMS